MSNKKQNHGCKTPLEHLEQFAGITWPKTMQKENQNCAKTLPSGGSIFITNCFNIFPGFVQVLENLESPGILFWHFPGLESPGKRPLVLESPGNV